MTVADLPAIGKLFLKIFRGTDADGTPEFHDYLKALTFGAPLYSESLGSFVYAQRDGRIRSALLAIPMQFVAYDRIISARLLCAYMSDTQTVSASGAPLALTMRASYQELAFSDSASPTSMAHMKAVKGVVLPLQDLEWTRTLRPLSAFVGKLERRFRRSFSISTLMRPLDALLRTIFARIVPVGAPAVRVHDMTLDAFLEQAPGLIAHYAVRPLWPRDELSWLLRLASQNTSFGPLCVRAVYNQSEELIGCFLFYGERGRPATILNILAHKGKETSVLAAMVHDLDRIGCVEIVGRAQHALMEGLAAQCMLTFRHKAFVCLTTRHTDIVLAAERGDIYIGGLAGESWSRLMSDF